MPEFPAFCDSCGTIFGSGYVFDNCRSLHLSNNKAGPCPSCGGAGSLPDGVFETSDKAIRLISGNAKTQNSLNTLKAILLNAQKQNLPREKVTRAIEDEVPELRSLSSVLPKTRNELYAFITVIIAAIALLITLYPNKNEKNISEDEIQKLIDKSVDQAISSTKRSPISQPKKVKKQNRNDPCACGSGIKYKKCCYLTTAP